MATTTASDAIASPTCTVLPDKNGYIDPNEPGCDTNYPFYPNFNANVAFAVMFGLTTLVHIAQAAVYKKAFCWVMIMGAAWETIAFSLRSAGARDQQQLGYAVPGVLLLLLASLWINAFLYMTVARLIHFVLPEKKVWGLRATLLTKLFVWLDILSFTVQGAGGSMLSNTEKGEGPSNITRIGQKVYVAGMAVQGVFIIIFSVLTAKFYMTMMKDNRPDRDIRRVRILVWVMYAVFVLILMRIIYRLIEFIPPPSLDNPIFTNENFTFGLDGFPMLLSCVLLNIVHPGTVLRGPESEFSKLSRKEKKALKQAKKDEKKAAKDAKKRAKKGEISHYADTYEMIDTDRDSSRPNAHRHV